MGYFSAATLGYFIDFYGNRMLWRALEKVDQYLAKVGVEGSNPFARSRFPQENQMLRAVLRGRFLLPRPWRQSRGSRGEAAESVK